MKTKRLAPLLALAAFSVSALAGCGASEADEGGVSTATPMNGLHRPPPEETAGGPAASHEAGTLPSGK